MRDESTSVMQRPRLVIAGTHDGSTPAADGRAVADAIPGARNDEPDVREIVKTYAIGGACQLLHVMDHVIAERGFTMIVTMNHDAIFTPSGRSMTLVIVV